MFELFESLLSCELVERGGVGAGFPAGGVEQFEIESFEPDVGGDDIAGGTGLRRGDGGVVSGQGVEQGTFSGIGQSGDHDLVSSA